MSHNYPIACFRSAVKGIALVALVAPTALADDPSANEFFERSVRPVLVERCYQCHGSDDEVQGGLRLTSREALLAGGESGPAAIAGKPGESLLIAAIKRDGLEMPPEGELNAQEIGTLQKWVEMGMPWPEDDLEQASTPGDEAAQSAAWQQRIEAGRRHWSLQPVCKPATPTVKDLAWPKTEIDRFILAAIEAKDLHPSPAADRAVLLRRVTFDLTGLPPTPEELASFLNDTTPNAWEKVIDRLLASPQYGERWARHWLDVARYGDTKGYVLFESEKYPWAYTYRDYVIRAFNEDLPYDQFIVQQLAADRLPLGEDKRALTAMGFLTVGNKFLNEHDRIDDRIDVVMRGLQGLSVSCARCHDHKFDPISTRDYYSLYGIMASSVEPLVLPLFETPPMTSEYATFAEELAGRQQKLADFVDQKYTELENSTRARLAEYLLAADVLRGKPSTDNFLLFAGKEDLNPTMTRRWRAYLEHSRRTKEPVFALWHALAALPPAEFSDQATKVLDQFSSPQMTVASNSLILAAVVAKPPTTLDDLAARYAEVFSQVVRAGVPPLGGDQKPPQGGTPAAAIWQTLYGNDSPCNLKRTPDGDTALLPYKTDLNERTKLLGEVESWCATGTGAPPRAMILEDRPIPYEPRVFGRGNPNNLREAVPRQFVQILSAADSKPFTQGSGRLELAQAIASRDNPLTARVFVNRVWQHHFGSGLVRSPSDFGLRGEPPTHPDLLDYLAATFMERGWSVKQLHRAILLSAVYQQASADRSECFAADPENRLLWKFPRLRVEFEAFRDSCLAIAGRLNRRLYGPPNTRLSDVDATRRTIYCFIDRVNVPGLLRAFDFPNPDISSPGRDATTVPQQSLFVMNHPFIQATAKAFLDRPDVAAETTIDGRVQRLYLLLFSRSPTNEEMAMAREFLGEPIMQQRWLEYAQSLLMTNEFVFVD